MKFLARRLMLLRSIQQNGCDVSAMSHVAEAAVIGIGHWHLQMVADNDVISKSLYSLLSVENPKLFSSQRKGITFQWIYNDHLFVKRPVSKCC